MRLIQLNLNHCRAAQDLLAQSVRELRIDVAVLCEQYRDVDRPGWLSDSSRRAAIWSCGSLSPVASRVSSEDGFVRGEVAGVTIYSCYASPNEPIASFHDFLGRLVADIRGQHRVILMGDFNAWATDWGSRHTDVRGRALLDALAATDLVLLNSGTVPTFVKGARSSIVDLAFASPSLVRKGYSWGVSGHYTHSDHQAVVLELQPTSGAEPRVNRGSATTRWRTGQFEVGLFSAALDLCHASGPGADANEDAALLSATVTKACDATMRRITTSGDPRRTPVYWWTEEIARLRAASFRARRVFQRSMAKHRPCEVLRQQHLALRSELSHCIKASKNRCWNELCSEVDKDPWGRPYRLVMRTVKGGTMAQVNCPIALRNIVEALFPAHPETEFVMGTEPCAEVTTVDSVSREELLRACKRVGNKKAPGLDGIPNVALKAAITTRPRLFAEVYDRCLREGTFPSIWKRQKLVLIPKAGKPPGEPSSYRPLCMLDTAGKVLETVLHGRLEQCIEQGLSDSQYGFRKGRSANDAVAFAVQTARAAVSGTYGRRGTRRYCLLVTLDVKNAFNSASWACIWRALNANFRVPLYLRRMVASYLSGRVLWYDTLDGPRSYRVTSGVPQGSVLGPMLWNVMYDGLLRLDVPSEAKLIAFADDVAVAIVARELDDVEFIFHETMLGIQSWMSDMGLALAGQKTEAVLITGRKQRENITLRVGTHNIRTQRSIRYLGIMVDQKLRFDDHLQSCSAKAAAYASSLSRLMPNIGGPRQSRRLLLASVCSSVLLYGAPVWSDALRVASYRRRVAAVYRQCALRVICAYRTVSDEAACVVAGMLPVDILAAERRRVYERKKAAANTSAADCAAIHSAERRLSLLTWQSRWDSSPKGRWSHRLIPNIRDWVTRSHGSVNYHLTQLLTGHGCFRSYTAKLGRRASARCPACPERVEDAGHILLECPRFMPARSEYEAATGRSLLAPEGLVRDMLQSSENWAAASRLAAAVMGELQRLENVERREPGVAPDTPE